MKKPILAAALILSAVCLSFAQSVAVSPSRLYYKVNIGDYKNQVIRVTNNSDATQSFALTFGDFEAPGSEGKSTLMEPGTSEHSCANWLSADPAFFQLGAGQTQEVRILLQIPNTPEANTVRWATAIVKLVKEKDAEKENATDGVGMGILQTFQFVVHIFQTPPSVTYMNAEILNFKEITAAGDTARRVSLLTKNIGDAILNCASYIDITSLNTGEEQRLKPFAFTVLPGGSRDVKFSLPKNLKPGKYSLLGVIDYGSETEVQAAEMEIEVK